MAKQDPNYTEKDAQRDARKAAGEQEKNVPGVGKVVESIPQYAPFISEIVEVKSRDTIVVEANFKDEGISLSAQDGDYEGTNPRKPLTFHVTFDNIDVNDLSHYLYTEDNNLYLIVNTHQESEKKKLLKLYSSISEASLQNVSVIEEIIDPVEEDVLLIPEDEIDEDVTFLLDPQFDLEAAQGSFFDNKSTQYKNLSDLITSDVNISEQIRTDILSSSLQSVDLNIDFEKYDNFTVFGSAVSKLDNAKYKFDKIESLLTTSASLATSSTTGSLGKELSSVHRQIRDVKLNFTPYEKYLYSTVSTVVSGSEFLGTERYNASWPKTGSGTFSDPYTPITSSHADFTSWYGSVVNETGQAYSASVFDMDNENRLANRIPKYIVQDNSNEDFLNFIDMVGEMYDEVWTYINHIPKIYETYDSNKKGYSNDLIQDVAKSFGLDLYNGADLLDLPRYQYGQYQSGSDSAFTTYSAEPQKDLGRKIHRRLINNIPFFLKTKGTLKSLRGMVNMFGIPATILDVREYGGPSLPGQVKSFNIKRKFTKSLDFRGGQYVQVPWVHDGNTGRRPDTVEFRFNSVNSGSQTLVEAVNGSTKHWEVKLREDSGTTDNVGHVDFQLSGSSGYVSMSTSAMPLYDGEFWSVMVSRESGSGAYVASDSGSQAVTYRLAAKKYDAGRGKIYYTSETSMSIDGANTVSQSLNTSWLTPNQVNVGYGAAGYLTGSMMEFRYWNSPLTMSAFDNHVTSPKAYNGNHASASYTDLVFRLSFDDNKDLSVAANTQLQDKSGDTSLTTITGSAKNFSGNFYASVVDEDKMLVPNIGPKKESNVKMRVISSSLEGGGLQPYIPGYSSKRSEKSLLDAAPKDSPKVGIFFSPTDVIDEDIVRSLADLDFHQYVGDPRDLPKPRYRRLHEIKNAYWQKYSSPNNFWDYMRLIKYFDQIIFKQIKDILPARTRPEFGLTVKQNILERSKDIISRGLSFESPNFEGHIDASIYAKEVTTKLTGSINDKEGIISGSTEIFNIPTLTRLNYTGSHKGYWGNTYISSSVTSGGPEYVFEEVLQPEITGSIISPHNLETKYYYSSSVSRSLNLYYSSSTARSTIDSKYDQFSALANLMFEGCKQTNATTVLNNYAGNFDPVETSDTTPLRIVSQDPGKSQLRID